MRLKQIAGTVAASTALLAALAAPASAQGANAGGVNSGGVGGGGGGGTVTTTTPPPTSGPCAKITSFKPSGGFRPSSSSSIGAVWVNFNVSNCGTTAQTYWARVIETNLSTGDSSWNFTMGIGMDPNKTFSSGNIDNDYVPLNTSYDVLLQIIDPATGNVLTSADSVVTTPIDKSTLGGV